MSTSSGLTMRSIMSSRRPFSTPSYSATRGCVPAAQRSVSDGVRQGELSGKAGRANHRYRASICTVLREVDVSNSSKVCHAFPPGKSTCHAKQQLYSRYCEIRAARGWDSKRTGGGGEHGGGDGVGAAAELVHGREHVRHELVPVVQAHLEYLCMHIAIAGYA